MAGTGAREKVRAEAVGLGRNRRTEMNTSFSSRVGTDIIDKIGNCNGVCCGHVPIIDHRNRRYYNYLLVFC